jgi:acyl carrier protein phosphodiesterase
MATVKDALNKIEAHERECRALYRSIDKRLEDGSKRFDKLENMLWAVYPFIVASIVLARFI